MPNFWKKLPKPFFALAPMEEVTDTVFRQVIADLGKPDVFFTEFVNVDGLCSKGREKVIHRLQFSAKEQPIVAQIWGLMPENFYQIAKELVGMGFAGIDINMGCPEKNVIKKGACAALIENRSLAAEIITATKKGANGLPVSIKTRIGYNSIVTDDWIGFLLKQKLDALTIHGRTVREMSDVNAHWDEIGKAVKMRDELQQVHIGSDTTSTSDVKKVQTLIIGNGDVKDRADGLRKAKQYEVDGVMIGRAIFKNPWVFNSKNPNPEVSVGERLDLLLKHTRLFDTTWGNKKYFGILKKFYKIYCQGFPGASSLREKLMRAQSVAEVEEVVNEFKNNS